MLSDEERDEDADGLTNFDETRGCSGRQSYWSGLYNKEKPYYLTYRAPGSTIRTRTATGCATARTTRTTTTCRT